MHRTHFYILLVTLQMVLLAFTGRSQCITSFPYAENFESSHGNWTPGGTASDWSWGSPIKPVINAAASGSKCWITGTLTQSSYTNNQNSTLTSPCFNFSGLTHPYIRLKIFWETEKKYDGASFQYSADGGTTWTTLGSYADFVNCPSDNWYNTSNITALGSDGWSGNIQPVSSCTGGAGNGSGQWKTAQHSMLQLAGLPNVRFRFRFAAGNVCNNYDGFAVDDIWIGEAPMLTPDFTFSCASSNTVSFQAIASTCTTSYLWDFGDPVSGPDNTSTLANPTHSYAQPGIYTISLMDPLAPNPTPYTRQVTIIDVNTVITSPILCYGDKASLTVQVTPAGTYSYLWDTNPALTSANVSGLSAGTYSVKVYGPGVCSNADNITLTEPAAVRPFLGNDTVICQGSQLELKPGIFDSYVWQDGSSSSAFMVTQSGMYSVTVTEDNCTATDSVRVIVDCSDIYFPSAFTPDGNGLNDWFGAVGNTAGIRGYRLRVFNRWGALVFESRDPAIKWNGRIDGKPSATQNYVWLANYTLNSTGVVRQQKGTVLVIQ